MTQSADTALAIATRVLATYCRSLDTGDAAGLRQVFANDAELLLDDRTISGADAITASYESFFAAAAAGHISRHHVTNIEVLAVTDRLIDASAYLLTLTTRSGDLSIASGTYRDRLTLGGDDTWRIQRKAISLEVPFTRVATTRHDQQRRNSGD